MEIDLNQFYYVYILLSEKDNKHYIGFTSNLEKRFADHNEGKVNSTSYRRPLKLVYFEASLNKYDVIKREKYFKTGFGRRFLKNRLENFYNSG